jgi:hypothetical protein
MQELLWPFAAAVAIDSAPFVAMVAMVEEMKAALTNVLATSVTMAVVATAEVAGEMWGEELQPS